MLGMEFKPASGQLAHFSINVGDMNRAQAFYGGVFAWTFQAYGPPGFFMIDMAGAEVKPIACLGSIQLRRELVPGVVLNGFECTIAVADIDSTIEAIQRLGGTIVMAKCTLPAIGHLAFFQDPEGNLAGAMQYDSKAE